MSKLNSNKNNFLRVTKKFVEYMIFFTFRASISFTNESIKMFARDAPQLIIYPTTDNSCGDES